MIDFRGHVRRGRQRLRHIAVRIRVFMKSSFVRGQAFLRGSFAAGSNQMHDSLAAALSRTRFLSKSTNKSLSRIVALLWQRAYYFHYYLLHWTNRHGASARAIGIVILIGLSTVLHLVLQHMLDPYFASPDSVATLRTVIVTLGGALVGATAIAFSIIMFAVQINFARMPHGLFRRLSSDWKLLGSFAGSFLLAISVTASSVIPDQSWVAAALLTAGWATILILILFLYAYRRALFLISPSKQLQLLVKSAEKELSQWVRRARRAAPLFEREQKPQDDLKLSSSHDMVRALYFRTNPHWTATSRQAITHAVSFARRYAAEGDHEVAAMALSAVVAVNAAYVRAKGKTFFTTHLLFDNPLATDGFINETLEHLRQNVRIGVTRNDEQQIEQNLKALATLVSIYITIDYSNEHDTTKHHASLAAGYLAAAVESVIPHNMPDVLMEGTRLMGQSAQLFLACGDPTDIASIADKIALVACVGIAKEDHRAVTMAAMEQLARLTFNLLRTKNADIAFAAGELKKNVSLIAKLFLAIPENPLLGHTYLGPYYSLTSEQTLPAWLTKLANELIEGEASDEAIRAVIHNIDEWSDELYRTEKELLLAAIEKKSHFTFDVIHWIAHVTKILVAFANAPACDEHTKEEITKHAAWLISVLSWVPDDREAVLFVENFRMTETLFDAALDARVRDNGEVFEAARDMLLSWSSKAGRHRWTILERAIYALATLALWKDDASEAALLTGSIGTALAKENAPEQESRDRAAREIRRTAATLRRRDFAIRRIEHAMNQIDPAKLRPLLQDIANLLSPNTADEPVRREFF